MIKVEDIQKVSQIYAQVSSSLDNAIIGQKAVKKVLTTSLLCDKNSKILLTGNTGTGKTTISNYLGSSFTKERISVTSDLLPGEVQSQLINSPGFSFLQIDEFNRASGKLQSAFLELFAEKQISTGGKIYPFSDFYVFATQNSADIAGVFNVPQAVYDRFDVNIYFNGLTDEEKRELFFGDFVPDTVSHLDMDDIDYVGDVLSSFTLKNEDIDLFMSIFNYIDSVQFNSAKLFAGSNIRAHKYAIKLAKLNALSENRTTILSRDMADYILYLYLHRIDQNVVSQNSREVHRLFAKMSSDVLSLKRAKKR